MGIVFRQSVKTTIVIFLGALLGAFVIWLSGFYMPKQEFGFLRSLTNNAVVGTQLLLLGVHNTLGVYIHKFADNKTKRGVLLAGCLIVPIVVISISSIFYFVFKTNFTSFFIQPKDVALSLRYFAWLPVFAVLMMYQVVLEQYLVSQVIIALSSFVREVVLRIGNIIVIVLFGTQIISFDTLVAATVLLYLIPILIYSVIAFKTDGFSVSLNYKVFTKAEIKDIFQFTWYHSLLSISITLMGSIDTILLAKLDTSGFVSVAIYANAVFLLSVITMPYKAMFSATFPVMAAAYKDNDMLKVRDLFDRSAINILIGATFMVVLAISNLDNAIAVLPDGYEPIKPLVIILVIGTFTDMATGMNGQLLSISKYYRFNFYASLVLVGVIIALNVILVPQIGIYGTAWANSIGLILFNIAKFIYIKNKMNLQPFSKGSLLVLLAGAPALLAGYYCPRLFDTGHHIYVRAFYDVGLRSFIVLAIYFSMLLWLKPSNDLEQYISTIRKNKRLF